VVEPTDSDAADDGDENNEDQDEDEGDDDDDDEDRVGSRGRQPEQIDRTAAHIAALRDILPRPADGEIRLGHIDEPDIDLIDTDVRISRPIDGGVDVLRHFAAGVDYRGESGMEDVGQVHGWIGWSIHDEDLADAADAIRFDAAQVGTAAADIIDTYPENYIDAVLLIDRMYLESEWRGKRLSGVIITNLMALLRLDPESTVVVLQPELQNPEGGPYDDGPERDEAMAACMRHIGPAVWNRGGTRSCGGGRSD
jgi:hypothetical protein